MPSTTEPTTTTTPNSKWWARSMTIWGAIISTLASVLPTLGPLFGIDITPELIRQLGDQVVLVAQAVSGLFGTILTIYGRLRANTTLERRQLTMSV